MRPEKPRITPLGDEELEDVASLLPKIMVAGKLTAGRSNVMRTLVRHPDLFTRWTPLLDALLNGALSERDREILILRTAWNCNSAYEWGQHVVVARMSGLTDAEISRTREDPSGPDQNPGDALLLRAADELHGDTCLTDATWEQLAARYDERQLIEVVMVVGHYTLVAMALNSLGVPLDDGLPSLDDELTT